MAGISRGYRRLPRTEFDAFCCTEDSDWDFGAVCGPNVQPHQWTSRCTCIKVLPLLQEILGYWKRSSNSSSSIRIHEESRIPSRLHLGSVPSPQDIYSLTRWFGFGEVWWTMESCMDYASWGRQGLLRVAQLHVQEDLQGELQVSQGKPTVNFTEHLRWTVLRKLS